MTNETDGEMLARLGTDGAKWAVEFCKKGWDLGGTQLMGELTPTPGEFLHTWFANAIEAGRVAGFSAQHAVERLAHVEKTLREISRVKGTDYEVIAYEGEAYIVHHEPHAYDEPPQDQLMGSVGDLIRFLDDKTERMADVDLIRRAIADPGQFVPRGDNYQEPIPSWSARAVVAALATEPEPTPTEEQQP